eukprot:3261818-Ditylum_brightwellii.AAC.1
MEKKASKSEWKTDGKPERKPDWNRDIISDPEKAWQKDCTSSYEAPSHPWKMERAQSLQRKQGSCVIHSKGRE